MANFKPNNFVRNNFERHKGLSIIGLLVAIWILLTAALGLSRVLVVREKTVDISRQRLVAATVAREGLELMRAVRDTNWFNSRPWTSDLCDPAAPPFSASFILDATMVNNGTPPVTPVSLAQEELFINAQGEWLHDSSSGNRPTGFRRLLTVQCASATPLVLQLTSRVAYGTSTVEVKEELYNWLP